MAVKAYIFNVKPATLITSFPSMPPNTPKNLNDRGHGKSKPESMKVCLRLYHCRGLRLLQTWMNRN